MNSSDAGTSPPGKTSARLLCTNCGAELKNDDWRCPRCDKETIFGNAEWESAQRWANKVLSQTVAQSRGNVVTQRLRQFIARFLNLISNRKN